MNTALRLAVAALLTGTIAACGSDDTGDDSDTDIIEVTYDGTECTSNAPASVPAGEQTFVLKQQRSCHRTPRSAHRTRPHLPGVDRSSKRSRRGRHRIREI